MGEPTPSRAAEIEAVKETYAAINRNAGRRFLRENIAAGSRPACRS